MRRFTYFLLFALLVAPIASATVSSRDSVAETGTPNKYDELGGALEADFHAVMANYNVPGAAFVLVHGDDIVRIGTRGVRDVKKLGRVSANTVFPLASVSKTFAGTLSAMLAADGALKLNAPVKNYIPDLKLRKRGHVERLNLVHLLSHSSGLVPNAYDNLLDAGETLDVILPKYRKISPICSPGQCYGYQNIFFSLVEPAIEQATKQSYDDALNDRVFKPLEMDTASVGFDALRDSENHANPHVWAGKRRGWAPRKIRPNYYEVAPAAGVNASITDLAKWLSAQLGENPDVLSQDALGLLRTPQTKTTREKRRRFWKNYLKEAHYGLGWRIYNFEGHTLYFHGGGIQGFRSSVAYSPELGIGVAGLINAESRALDDFNTRFWSKVFSRPRSAHDHADQIAD